MTVDPAERLERATAEAREVIRELNGSLKDARAVLKELDQAVHDAVDQRIKDELRARFDDVNRDLAQVVVEASDKVERTFKEMVGLFLGTKSVADARALQRTVQAAGIQRRDLAQEIGTALAGRQEGIDAPRFVIADTKPEPDAHGKWR